MTASTLGSDSGFKIAVLLVEPAPYMTALVTELRKQHSQPVSVYYLFGGFSQKWGSTLTHGAEKPEILPFGVISAIIEIAVILWGTRGGVLITAGWGQPRIISALIMAKVLGIKSVVLSDTWESQSGKLVSAIKARILPFLVAGYVPGGRRQCEYLVGLGVRFESIIEGGMTSDIQTITDHVSKEGLKARRRIRSQLGIAIDETVFIFLGRLETIKGPDLLVESFKMIAARSSAQLLIVGDGSMMTKLRRMANEEVRIHFLGRHDGTVVWDLLAASDILVVPSRFEPWGLVINEAMAAGLPIIASDRVGCLPDLNPDGTAGATFRTDNAIALSEAMLTLTKESETRERLRIGAKKNIADWTTSRWANNIIQMCRKAYVS